LIGSAYTHPAIVQKPKPIKGRGAASNAASRFMGFTREAFDDDWEREQDEAKIRTQVYTDTSRRSSIELE